MNVNNIKTESKFSKTLIENIESSVRIVHRNVSVV